jgi:predicted RNA polymerase sigma factor
MPRTDSVIDRTVRAAIPLVIAALVRRYGDLADCEDAVQEALIEAATAWPAGGRPDDPRAWLLTVARRRYIDALEPVAQVALTLRAVCGLPTAQIAAAFFTTEAAMTRRISRAKRAIDDAGRAFGAFDAAALAERAEPVRTALYLMFTEGHAPADGELPVHAELVAEAVRLTRLLHAARPDDAETTALLGLLLLTDARTPARVDADGALVSLADQDRARWRADELVEGRRLAAAALADGPVTPLHVQAALAAVHAAAARAIDTDWVQIVALYDALVRLQPGPAAALGRAAAIGMARGPLAGLAELAQLEGDERLARGHRLPSVRAGLLERAGAFAEARDAYLAASDRTANSAERRWLRAQADRITEREREGETP